MLPKTKISRVGAAVSLTLTALMTIQTAFADCDFSDDLVTIPVEEQDA